MNESIISIAYLIFLLLESEHFIQNLFNRITFNRFTIYNPIKENHKEVFDTLSHRIKLNSVLQELKTNIHYRLYKPKHCKIYKQVMMELVYDHVFKQILGKVKSHHSLPSVDEIEDRPLSRCTNLTLESYLSDNTSNNDSDSVSISDVDSISDWNIIYAE